MVEIAAMLFPDLITSIITDETSTNDSIEPLVTSYHYRKISKLRSPVQGHTYSGILNASCSLLILWIVVVIHQSTISRAVAATLLKERHIFGKGYSQPSLSLLGSSRTTRNAAGGGPAKWTMMARLDSLPSAANIVLDASLYHYTQ
jgi:hypothetical protein